MSVASVGFNPASAMPLPDNVHRAQVKQPDAPVTEPEQKKPKPQAIHSTAASLQRLVFNRKLQFVVDHNSNEIIVKVIDKETDKVIKELPPEELQRLHNNLKETIGFLFDERV